MYQAFCVYQAFILFHCFNSRSFFVSRTYRLTIITFNVYTMIMLHIVARCETKDKQAKNC